MRGPLRQPYRPALDAVGASSLSGHAPRDIAADHHRHPDCHALSSVAETLDGVSPWLYALAIGSFRGRHGSAEGAWCAERMGLAEFCGVYALSPRRWDDARRRRVLAEAVEAFGSDVE